MVFTSLHARVLAAEDELREMQQLAWQEAVLTAEVQVKRGNEGRQEAKVRGGLRIDKISIQFPPKTDKV